MNIKNIKPVIFILAFFLVSYAAYFVLDQETAIQLALEDNAYETITALFFFGTAWYFYRNFRITGNWYFLLLVVLFLFGGAEEMSWGQRYLGFETPEAIDERNRQNEFNIHNLDVFHPQEEGGISKTGLSKLITMDFLYNLFWLAWCILVPLLSYSVFFKNLFGKLRLPIPSLTIGVFFLVNFIIFYVTRSFTSPDKSSLYYMRYREIFECCSALVFLVLASTFYRHNKEATAD